MCSQQPPQLNLTQTPCREGSGEFIHWTVVVSIIIDLPISCQGGKLELRGWTRKSGKFKRIREVQGFVRMCFGLGQEGIQSSWRGAGSSLDTSSWRQARGLGGQEAGQKAFEVVTLFGGWHQVITRSETQLLKPDWFLHFWRFFVYFLLFSFNI